MRRVGLCCIIALLWAAAAAQASASAAADGNEPATPVPANDSEKQLFCKESALHHLPELIGEAASSLLGHGFHFDSFQQIPVAQSTDDTHGAPIVTSSYRIQVMDDQNQAREIKVQASADGHPMNVVKSHWMCWLPSDPATAQRLDPAQQNSQEAKR